MVKYTVERDLRVALGDTDSATGAGAGAAAHTERVLQVGVLTLFVEVDRDRHVQAVQDVTGELSGLDLGQQVAGSQPVEVVPLAVAVASEHAEQQLLVLLRVAGHQHRGGILGQALQPRFQVVTRDLHVHPDESVEDRQGTEPGTASLLVLQLPQRLAKASNTLEIEEIVRRSEPPWIIKPRLTAHGVNIKYTETAEQLKATFSELHNFQKNPIVQEYVQGTSRRNFYVTIDGNSELLTVLSPEVIRTYSQGFLVRSKTVVSSSTGPCMEELRALIRNLRLVGGFTIQTKIDANDGLPKLMEINARFGQHLWYRTELLLQ